MIVIAVNELNIMGGTHKQVLRLAQYLKRTGVDYLIVTKYYDPLSTYEEFKELNILSLARQPRVKLKFLKNLYDVFMQVRLSRLVGVDAECVNVHDNGLPFFILINFAFRRRVVWQINDLPWVFAVGNAESISKNRLRNIFSLFSRFFYRRIVAPSVTEITVNVAKNRARVERLLNRKARLFHCGVDAWKGSPASKKGFEHTLNLLSSGVFSPYRNYESIIYLVKKLAINGFDVKLNIIGSVDVDRSYASKIKGLIAEQGLNDNVYIHGQVSHKDYQHLHEISDVFIFVNVDQSWGLAVFEAMSAGLPVIVSESVGATELLTNNSNAFFVNPFDVDDMFSKIKTLECRERYVELSVAGVNYVASLTWDKLYSDKMLNLMTGERV